MTLTREEAIKRIIAEKVYIEDIPGSDKTVEALEMAIEALEEEPRIRAEWIDEPNCWYRCSHCGSHYPSIIGIIEYNYCPNCGADMREED